MIITNDSNKNSCTEYCSSSSACLLTKNIVIRQNWWHIEAIFPPNPAHRVRQVMDIYVPYHICKNSDCKNDMCAYKNINRTESLSFNISKRFSGLKIYARNAKNNEIAFIEENDDDKEDKIIRFTIVFKTDEFPIVKYNENPYLHVKLELNYLLPSNADISETGDNSCQNSVIEIDDTDVKNIDIKGWIRTDIDKPMQPEFYLTFPVGWKIAKEPGTTSDNPEHKNTTICYFTAQKQDSFPEIDISLGNPVTTHDNIGRKVYSYTADSDGKDICKVLDSGIKSMQITYLAQMRSFFSFFCYTMPNIILTIICLAIVVVFCSVFFGKMGLAGGVSVFVSCAILTIAYYYTYITLRHQDYYFPEKTKQYFTGRMRIIACVLIVSMALFALACILIELLPIFTKMLG